MTHDPLCIGSRLPEDVVWPDQCRCYLIARAREDERSVVVRANDESYQNEEITGYATPC